MLPLMAQTDVPDTVYGRHYQYYYENWYDECDDYYTCSPEVPTRNWFYVDYIRNAADYFSRPFDLVGRRYTVPGRMAIKGMVAMGGGQVKPEFLALFQHDTTVPGNTAFLDMVRWDTAARKVMKLPQCVQTMNLGDSTKFLYIDAYEVYLPKPVVVDSVFYIAGTFNSDSTRRYTIIDSIYWSQDSTLIDSIHTFQDSTHIRCTYYNGIRKRGRMREGYCDSCINTGNIYYNFFPVTRDWYSWYGSLPICGLFLAIVDSDYYQLTVLSDSLPMGTVEGGGHYVSMSRVQISATPEPGYRFAMWSDGSTENPRTVEVYYDTVFTALFTEESNFIVGVEANHPTWGSVAGGGIYAPGQTATIEATAADDRYRFIRWADGDTANPRMAVIDRDTVFTAVFATLTGIADVQHNQLEFVISPNPSHDRVTLTTAKEGCYNVSVFDNSGHQVTTAVFAGTQWTLDVGRFADGTYYIRLLSAEGDGTKSFVKQ